MSPNYSALFPPRSADAHKGQCGRLGIVAGSDRMIGAAVMTAMAALRAGAGLVVLMTVESAVGTLNVIHPEIIVEPLATRNGALTRGAFPQVIELAQTHRLSGLAVGPGLGQMLSTQALVREIVTYFSGRLPIVVDADGLNALSRSYLAELSDSVVLTPHIGEFERLFEVEVGSDRQERTTRMAQETDMVVVLKGKGTVIADRGHCVVNESGNSGMATAGSGDVLTGIVGTLLAQDVSLFDAAVLGVYLHGLAGDLAADQKGIGLIASDMIELIPMAISKVRNGD